MKIFDARFASGTILVGIGTVGTIAGILSFLPPTSNVILGILLVVICPPMAVFGYQLAKNASPSPTRTSVEALHKAGLLDKN